MANWPIRRRRRRLPSNSSAIAPSWQPWASPSNPANRSILRSLRARISPHIVCNWAMSPVFDCALRRRIFPFSPQRIIWPVPCQSPRPPCNRCNIPPVRRRVCLRPRFLVLDWIPSRRALAPSPFPTNSSRWSISVASPQPWMSTVNISMSPTPIRTIWPCSCSAIRAHASSALKRPLTRSIGV